jgi:hypothetical protein
VRLFDLAYEPLTNDLVAQVDDLTSGIPPRLGMDSIVGADAKNFIADRLPVNTLLAALTPSA